jgi:hypothetical protein
MYIKALPIKISGDPNYHQSACMIMASRRPSERDHPGQQAHWRGAPAAFGAAPPHGRTIRTKMCKRIPSRRSLALLRRRVA